MSILDSTSSIELTSDADLVEICLSGDRNAFGRIVQRYQRLLCSLAYSATGQLSQSEDLAQEAFVEAWRQLGNLREPEKLRPWLCGILRYKVSRLRRSDGREPLAQSGPIELAGDFPSNDQATADRAIEKEEQAIMWSALERVPELYREPLVLYYREHRSVEHVAAALDLTEDNVKQRLARGRKILQEQVLAFVEGALTRSTPGRVFTLGVLAALPEFATPAKAIGIGAAAAHGGMLAKTTGIAALLASVTGLATTIMTLRATLDQARTPRERRTVVKSTLGCVLGSVGLLAILYCLRASAYRWWDQREHFATIASVLALLFIVAWPLGLIRMLRNARAMRTSERKEHPEYFLDPKDHVGSAASEYRSKARFLGVPWVHYRFASPDAGARPVFGWIAGGDRAYGLLFAWGGVAIAPISVGAFSVGLLSVGALGIGVIGLGTFGVGLIAMGAVAVGVKTFAWLTALGWETAQSGGFSIARIAAEGPVALALHANDPIAREILANPDADRNQSLFFIVMVLFSLLPMAYYAREVRKRLGKKAGRERL